MGNDILGVLLAGGAGRRIGGGDKCLRELAGRTLLDHVIERVRAQVGGLILSANGDPERFAKWGLAVIPDAQSGEKLAGPLAGIAACLDWAAGQSPA